MNLLKRILTSIKTVQAAVLALLNLLAVFQVVSLTDIQLGALNLAILAIAQALSEVLYGKRLDDLGAAVNAEAAKQVKASKAETLAALPEGSAVDRSFLEKMLAS